MLFIQGSSIHIPRKVALHQSHRESLQLPFARYRPTKSKWFDHWRLWQLEEGHPFFSLPKFHGFKSRTMNLGGCFKDHRKTKKITIYPSNTARAHSSQWKEVGMMKSYETGAMQWSRNMHNQVGLEANQGPNATIVVLTSSLVGGYMKPRQENAIDHL